MLNDLSWLADGKPWPPEDKDEAQRRAEHATNRQIYDGLHDKVFPRYLAYLADAAKDSKKQAIILDWPELATSSYLSLLFGEEPEVKLGERDDPPERPDGEVFTDVSRYGLGLYEISQDNSIIAVNPENCYLVVNPGNIKQAVAYAIFNEFEREGADKKPHKYVKFTIHKKEAGRVQIQHLLFEVVADKLTGPIDLAAFFPALKVGRDGIQEPPVDDLLVVRVDNVMSSERYYGRSDYRPSVKSLVESLELLFAQRSEVLAKFTNPTPVIPESATVFDQATKEWVYKPGKPIITQPGDSAPSLMVWDAQLANVNSAIEQSMDQLLQMLQLSRVLLAGKDAGTAESGTALRIRLIPTLSKVGRLARAAEKAIPRVLHLWSQLFLPEVAIADVHVRLQDGIPEDPMETATTTQLWDAMGAVSLERKLELQGFKEGSEAFTKELERLRASEQSPEEPGLKLPELGGLNAATE